MTRGQKKLRITCICLITILALVLFARSLTETTRLESDSFSGIELHRKKITNIIIVHGIGSHCIGYSDTLIHNLLKRLTGTSPEKSLHKFYRDYLIEELNAIDTRKEWTSKAHIQPMRDGSCKPDFNLVNKIARYNGYDVLVGEFRAINAGQDHESVVLSQDALCKTIYEASEVGSSDATSWNVDCYKLSVRQRLEGESSDNPEYITGFVRRTKVDVEGEKVRLYELTWSPATRWIEQSLLRLEELNLRSSRHWFNRKIKEIVNTGFVDAFAYFSDSGVLVNNNILQTYCLTFADDRQLTHPYNFKCNSDLLKHSEGYSERNDLFLISHSLGARVVFDSVGLLARGASGGSSYGEHSESGLVDIIATKLQTIGVEVPNLYRSDSEFAEVLAKSVVEFSRSIRSFFMLANQIPLLSANITTPFDRRDQDAGLGFKDFLELRAKPTRSGSTPEPLQIVSFHDPDDVLGYDLTCWYHQSVIRHLRTTREIIREAAVRRAKSNQTEVGWELRLLRQALFQTCSRDSLEKRNQLIFDKILSEQQTNRLVRFVNGNLSLQSIRIEGLVANPWSLHSNYFHDRKIHDWIADGSERR